MSFDDDYLYLIIDTIEASIFWKDTHGRYLGCNQYMVRMSGFKNRADLIGKKDCDMPWWQIADKLEAIDRSVLKNGIFEGEETPLTASSKKIVFHTKKTILYDNNNKIVGIIGISIDITERKKAETLIKKKQKQLIKEKDKAQAANQAKTEFLANMRHDIRTPLSGIVGFSEILKTESNEPRIKEYADNLVASSHALLDLMDEVLEAVKVSSGDIPKLKRKFNLNHTLEQVVCLYSAKAQEKKLNLSLSVDKKLPKYVIGDKIRVHRIALELIGNALNFTDRGYVTIKIELAKQKQRHLVLRMIVSDSGIGIPKDKQQEIYKGSGLGLYVVKQFVDELAGEIYVDSEPHKGTVFTCLIPLLEPLLDDDSGVDNTAALKTEQPYLPLSPLTHQHQSVPLASENKAKSTVLVVEDNFIAQTVAKSILNAMECRVDVASNGADAIAFCEQNHYDLIFMDIGLGTGMDGYEVTHHIRSQIDNTRHIPIIALTAHAADESKQRCIEAGMDAVLTKPLTQAHAIDILKSFIPERYETPEIESSKTRKDLPDSDDEMFQLNQFPILNSEEALKNCATHEMLKELLTLMTQELPADLERMKNAFKALDYPLVEKTAHKIKGGAVYVGTIRMKYACQYVERYWKTGQRELFDILYHQAVSTIEETITYIEGWLQRNTP